MGAHYVDVTSGEFQGKTFTETFLFGSFDGKVTFYEPMITLDFLKKNSNYVREIPQPEKVQKTSWYPTKMKIVKHNGITEIILDQFVYRKQPLENGISCRKRSRGSCKGFCATMDE
jgi:hypothetical protein